MIDEKLQAGMWGRLFTGDIVKIKEVLEEFSPIICRTDIKKILRTWDCDFKKWGFNIASIIESGDFVNGKEVDCIQKFTDCYVINFVDNSSCGNNEVKTIITKEKMEEIYKFSKKLTYEVQL